MLGDSIKKQWYSSAIALSRQKVPYINPKNTVENRCIKGAYVVNITSHESNVTIVASGTEVELALKVQEKLRENNIHSKVVSMPCMELFDKQPEDFREDIIEQNSFVVTIEAGSIVTWQKYIKKNGVNIYRSIWEKVHLTKMFIVILIYLKIKLLVSFKKN